MHVLQRSSFHATPPWEPSRTSAPMPKATLCGTGVMGTAAQIEEAALGLQARLTGEPRDDRHVIEDAADDDRRSWKHEFATPQDFLAEYNRCVFETPRSPGPQASFRAAQRTLLCVKGELSSTTRSSGTRACAAAAHRRRRQHHIISTVILIAHGCADRLC